MRISDWSSDGCSSDLSKIHIKDGLVSEFLDRVQQVLDEMRHEKTFLSTSLCAHPTDENTFLLFEVWKDKDEFFTTQLDREYRRPHTDRFKVLVVTPPVFEEWHELRLDIEIGRAWCRERVCQYV